MLKEIRQESEVNLECDVPAVKRRRSANVMKSLTVSTNTSAMDGKSETLVQSHTSMSVSLSEDKPVNTFNGSLASSRNLDCQLNESS